MKIGFIGIGQMGRHMSRRILEAGYDLTVHDLRKEAASFLIEKGARWADTPGELARICQVVFSSLPTPQSVEEVVYGAAGLQSGWKEGDIYIDMSTNSASTIRRIARDAKVTGVSVLDAPVSGGTTGAEMGTLAIMVGGDAQVLERVRKLLETMGRQIFLVGGVGCGNIAKLINNLISLTNNSITSEGFVLGVKAGINPQILFDIIKVSTGNNWSLQQLPATVFKGDFEPGFKVSLGLKDIGLALDLSKECGVPLSVGEAVQQELANTVKSGYAGKSVQSVILYLEDIAGVKVRTTG